MPDDMHLIVWPSDATFRVRSLLAAIKLPVSRRVVAYVTAHAPAFLPRMLDVQRSGTRAYRFWQRGGGYDRDLHEPGTMHATIDYYIHANPVRAGLVERPELCHWSSAAFFAGTWASPLIPNVELIPDPPKHWRF